MNKMPHQKYMPRNVPSRHEEGIEKWIKELREEHPDRNYYIISIPKPDALELDIKSGKITALEYETSRTNIHGKRKHYETLGTDFDEVIISCKDKFYQQCFCPPKPKYENRFLHHN